MKRRGMLIPKIELKEYLKQEGLEVSEIMEEPDKVGITRNENLVKDKKEKLDELFYENIMERMQNSERGITLKTHRVGFSIFTESFLGLEGVLWLEKNILLSTKIAIKSMQELINLNYIFPMNNGSVFHAKSIYRFYPKNVEKYQRKKKQDDEKLTTRTISDPTPSILIRDDKRLEKILQEARQSLGLGEIFDLLLEISSLCNGEVEVTTQRNTHFSHYVPSPNKFRPSLMGGGGGSFIATHNSPKILPTKSLSSQTFKSFEKKKEKVKLLQIKQEDIESFILYVEEFVKLVKQYLKKYRENILKIKMEEILEREKKRQKIIFEDQEKNLYQFPIPWEDEPKQKEEESQEKLQEIEKNKNKFLWERIFYDYLKTEIKNIDKKKKGKKEATTLEGEEEFKNILKLDSIKNYKKILKNYVILKNQEIAKRNQNNNMKNPEEKQKLEEKENKNINLINKLIKYFKTNTMDPFQSLLGMEVNTEILNEVKREKIKKPLTSSAEKGDLIIIKLNNKKHKNVIYKISNPIKLKLKNQLKKSEEEKFKKREIFIFARCVSQVNNEIEFIFSISDEILTYKTTGSDCFDFSSELMDKIKSNQDNRELECFITNPIDYFYRELVFIYIFHFILFYFEFNLKNDEKKIDKKFFMESKRKRREDGTVDESTLSIDEEILSLQNFPELNFIKQIISNFLMELPQDFIEFMNKNIKKIFHFYFNENKNMILFLPTIFNRKNELKDIFISAIFANLREMKGNISLRLNELKLIRRDIESGERKNRLTTWWLELVEFRVNQLLKKNQFQLHLIPEDYCSSPPDNLILIQSNLTLLENVMENKKNQIKKLIQKLREIITPKIETFINDCFYLLFFYLSDENSSESAPSVVKYAAPPLDESQESPAPTEKKKGSRRERRKTKKIKKDVVGQAETANSTEIESKPPAPEESEEEKKLKKAMELFQVKKKSLLKTQPEIIDWIEESISDIEYLIEMQKLEDDEYLQSNKNPHIVPISGLVYSVFFRYINEHKTVLDCWQQEDTASQVLSPNSNEFLSHSHSKLSLQSSISYLHYLILQNQTEPCNFIIDKLLKTSNFNEEELFNSINKLHNLAGESILHSSIRLLQFSIANKLLKIPCLNINILDKNRNHILHLIEIPYQNQYLNDQYKLFKKILAKRPLINSINKFGETPLHIACLAGCVKIVKLFLEFGANIHTVTKNKSESALHYAVRSGSCEVVALLLNYAAEPAQSSASGDSPIDLAIKLKKTSIIDCFKSSAVGLNEKSINKKR